MRANLVLPTYYILLWNVFIVFFLHLVFFLLRIFFFGFLFIGLRGIIGRHSCFTDYARNLNGKRPVRSRQLKLYVKVTQISQMTQIQTCSVYGITQIQTYSVYGMTQIFFFIGLRGVIGRKICVICEICVTIHHAVPVTRPHRSLSV